MPCGHIKEGSESNKTVHVATWSKRSTGCYDVIYHVMNLCPDYSHAVIVKRMTFVCSDYGVSAMPVSELL